MLVKQWPSRGVESGRDDSPSGTNLRSGANLCGGRMPIRAWLLYCYEKESLGGGSEHLRDVFGSEEGDCD